MAEHVVRPDVPGRLGRRDDPDDHRDSIPCLLSFLAYQDIHATVQGIDSFAPAPTPPINLLFQVYHFMIVMGPALAGIGLLAGLWFLWKRRLYESRFVLWLLVLTVFLARRHHGRLVDGRDRAPAVGRLQRPDDRRWRVAGAERHRRRALAGDVHRAVLAPVRAVPVPAEPQDPGGTGGARGGRDRAVSSLPDTFRDIFSRPPPRRRPGRGAMTINDVWFALFILIIAGYLILDGFDMGVGILLLPLARTDRERRTFLNSIGPVWDGNEVWLVLAGGVLFAVFPLAYASLFSGLLPRVHARPAGHDPAHGRARVPHQGARHAAGAPAWDAVFARRRWASRCCSGVAFGNIVAGLPSTPTATSRRA